jgi:hypothetical protein
VTYDRAAGSYSLYVNGAREVANATSYPKADPTGAYWVMGHSETSSTTDSWRGLLDEMRMYNRILNVNDARALYFESGGQPALSVQQSGNSLTIVWSVAASGFQLQSTDDLGVPGGWANITDTPVIAADGITQSVTINAGIGAKFYRLHK